jgi:hypothetical protein
MSYLPNNPYLLNIVPLFNVADPTNGIDTGTLAGTLSNVEGMVDTTTNTIYANSIQPFTTGGITGVGSVEMVGDFNVIGALSVNGFPLGTDDGGNTLIEGNSFLVSTGANALQITSNTGSTDVAINFITANNSVMSIDGLGRVLYKGDGISSNVNRFWISSSVLHADRAAIGLGGSSNLSSIFDVWSGDAYFNCNVNIAQNAYALAFNVISDRRYKEDIYPISGALSTICQLKGAHYMIHEKPSIGFIAQEVQEVIPEAVSPMNDGTLTIDYSKIIPVLVEAVKELALRSV